MTNTNTTVETTTINKVIETADGRRVNIFSPEDKALWINQVDRSVQRDVMHVATPTYFRYDEDADKDLSVTGEWIDLYVLYVIAQCDFWEQDTAKYNNSAKMYNDMYENFKKQWTREHPRTSSFVNLI